jgi:hypothetical protein
MVTGWVRPGGGGVRLAAPPQFTVRLAGALLALAVAGVHVADQGGITAFNSPDWRRRPPSKGAPGALATPAARMRTPPRPRQVPLSSEPAAEPQISGNRTVAGL